MLLITSNTLSEIGIFSGTWTFTPKFIAYRLFSGVGGKGKPMWRPSVTSEKGGIEYTIGEGAACILHVIK